MIGENIFTSIIKRALVAYVVVGGLMLMLIDKPKPYILGLLFGMVINLLNFRLMSLSIEKAISLNEGRAQAYAVGNYLVRYMIYGIVLYIAATADYIDLLSVILGFFTVKGIIVSDTLLDFLKGKRN